jgi:hypothetical protein
MHAINSSVIIGVWRDGMVTKPALGLRREWSKNSWQQKSIVAAEIVDTTFSLMLLLHHYRIENSSTAIKIWLHEKRKKIFRQSDGPTTTST